MESTMLTLGVLLIVLGLIGQVKAKELEVGTKNPYARIILGFIGVVFVSIAIIQIIPIPSAIGLANAPTSTPTFTPTFTPTASVMPSQTSTPTITPSPVPTLIHSPTPNTVNKEVFANQGWQSTGIKVDAGTTVDFEVIAGEWTSRKGIYPYTNGKGYELKGQVEYICSLDSKRNDCSSYPMPDFPLGSLIGQVGYQVFGIGHERSNLFVNASGILLLRMNDQDIGLSDNEGILTVQITVKN